MANSIIPKKSATPSAIPTSGDLLVGEIASNTVDGLLFLKKTDGTIVTIGAGGGGGGSGTVTSVGISSSDLKVTGSPITAAGEIGLELRAQNFITPGIYGSSSKVPQINVAQNGLIIAVDEVEITAGSGTVTSVGITSDDLTVTGSPITAAGDIDLELKEQNLTPGTYGSTSKVAQVTVAINGLITAVSEVEISGGGGGGAGDGGQW